MEDLETQVLAEWCRVTRADLLEQAVDRQPLRGMIEVLADQLQATGDPRGDVIALVRGGHVAGDAIANWLGLLLSIDGAVGVGAGVVHLVLDERNVNSLDRVLASNGARYLESIRISGSNARIGVALETLATREHRWLTTLELTASADGDPFHDDLVDRVIAATPNLSRLAISGRGLLRDFPHPALLALHTGGVDEIGALRGRGRRFPALVKLVIGHVQPDQIARIPALPALKSLVVTQRTAQTFALFEHLAARCALTHVTLPMILTAEDADRVERALTTLPRLERLVVAANYGDARGFFHPTATLEIPTFHPGA